MSRKASSTKTSTDPSGPPPAEQPESTGSAVPLPGGGLSGSHPFLVPVAALRRTVGASRHEVCQGLIEGLAAVSVSVTEGAPVVADVTLSSYLGGIAAHGTVSAPWVGECRRCGGTIASGVTAVVRERFTPEGGTDEDEDAYPMVGDQVDLEPMARDAVLLELPLAPLCSLDCRGLCPQCGANWNLSTCECVPAADPRWSALDALREPGDSGFA
jgi:uncharacterized protein